MEQSVDDEDRVITDLWVERLKGIAGFDQVLTGVWAYLADARRDDPAAAIELAREMIGESHVNLTLAVMDGRKQGLSWAEIAGRLGVTAEAAQHEYGHLVAP